MLPAGPSEGPDNDTSGISAFYGALITAAAAYGVSTFLNLQWIAVVGGVSAITAALSFAVVVLVVREVRKVWRS